jgi:hypothetical protein
MAASIIGYAQADFATLRADKNLYIDRTPYIRSMEEESNRSLIFVRPRRFGKSLWLSILHYYYAVEHKDKFDTLFGNLAIGQNPTTLRNSFMVLRMQFAGIDVETDKSTYQGFRANVMTGIIDCMTAYPAYFSEKDKAKIEATVTQRNVGEVSNLADVKRQKKGLFRWKETPQYFYPKFIINH